jgi:hypothetical protein
LQDRAVGAFYCRGAAAATIVFFPQQLAIDFHHIEKGHKEQGEEKELKDLEHSLSLCFVCVCVCVCKCKCKCVAWILWSEEEMERGTDHHNNSLVCGVMQQYHHHLVLFCLAS